MQRPANGWMMTRREALSTVSGGFGFLAFCGLAATEARGEYVNPLTPKTPHFQPRAKRVVMMTMRGGPSHLDTFDYKPALDKMSGKTVPGGKALASPFQFPRSGKSGLPISEIYPEVAKHADDICLLNSLCTDVPNHPQSFLMLHTGEFRFARPSMGAWALYGLGTENQDLPGFVTISAPTRFGGTQNYGSGFLPAIYQGTAIGSSGTPVANASIANLRPAAGALEQRKLLDLTQSLNRDLLARKEENLELEGVIESYELAFRMQRALPDVLDISKESPTTLAQYGISRGADKNTGGNPADFGRQCLMARRLLEAGVRFVEVTHEGWDQHNNLTASLKRNAGATDQPMGALLADLKQRGMLNDTLVIWGGEFGRTSVGQGTDGRNHNSKGFSMWLAGGGVKGGTRYGETDELGSEAVVDKMHHHDLHATILHLLGLDHERLSYRYGGRDYKLTGVGGAHVAEGVLA